MTPRPRWRWWLFCLALRLSRRVNWAWVTDVMVWSILPEWLGWDGKPLEYGEDP